MREVVLGRKKGEENGLERNTGPGIRIKDMKGTNPKEGNSKKGFW